MTAIGFDLVCNGSCQAGFVDCQRNRSCLCEWTVVVVLFRCQCIEGGSCDAVGTATDRFPCAPCQGGQGGRHVACVIHADIAIPGRHSTVDKIGRASCRERV